MTYKYTILLATFFIVLNIAGCEFSQLSSKLNTEDSLAGDYLSARYAVNAKERDKAIELFESALSKSNFNPELVRRGLELMLVTGNIDKANLLAKHYYDPAQRPSVVPMILVADAVQKGDWKKADKIISNSRKVKLKSDYIIQKIILPLLHVWIKAGKGDIKEAKEIMKNVPTDQVALFVLSQQALFNDFIGNKSTALDHYNELFTAYPRQSIAMREAAVSFYRAMGKDKRADTIIDHMKDQYKYFDGSKEAATIMNNPQAINAKTAVAEIFNEMAGLFFIREGYESAIAYYRLSYEINPEPNVTLSLARTLTQQGLYDSANDLYARIQKDSLHYISTQLIIAQNLYAAGNKARAVSHLRQAVAEIPDNTDLRLTLADLYLNSKSYDLAAPVYTEVINQVDEHTTEHWTMFYGRGIVYERLNQWDKAESDFKKALELFPDQPDVLNYLAYTWLEQDKNKKKAHNYLKKALELRPHDPHIIDSYGWALFKLERYEEAIEYLEQANLMMPYDPVINDHLGDVYWKVGRKTEARFQWKRVLTFDPEPELTVIVEKKLKEGLPNGESLSQTQT